MADVPAVVIDSGSGFTRAGLSGFEVPEAVTPSVVGRPRQGTAADGIGINDTFVGADAQARRGLLTLKHPIERGFVTNWEDLEVLWQDVLVNRLRVDPKEHPVLLTDSPQGPRAGREKMTEIMFETFEVPGMFVCLQGVLALYQSGRTTGLVVDSGDGVTHAIPCYEGYALPHAIMRLHLGGRDITDYLMQIMTDRGYSFTTTADREIVREMKEKLAYSALDYEASLLAAAVDPVAVEKSYVLPDALTMFLGNEAFRCTEALFQPSLLDSEAASLPLTAYRAAMKTDVEMRLNMFGNVVLAGGNTMYPGFVSRFTQELTALVSASTRLSVIAPPERTYSSWLGGSILASMPAFATEWIRRAEYEEHGPSLVHRRCF